MTIIRFVFVDLMNSGNEYYVPVLKSIDDE